jgi:methionine synthase II (cobalamin-independent)
MTEQVWAPGAVTGIGSMPGTDIGETQDLIMGELAELPYLAELPARGLGADMIGRSAGLLADLPVEVQPSGWRLTAHNGQDVRRARDFLARDLDALEAVAGQHTGPLKVQVAGPWTLAASIELPSGHRIVSDHGATRDLIESLVEGLTQHLGEVRKRLPNARLVVQLDEPAVPAVIAARVPTPSGYGTARGVERAVVAQGLEQVLAVIADGGRVVHCCAADIPIELLAAAGANAISFDPAVVGTAQDDALGTALEAGVSLWPGVVPSTDAGVSVISVASARRPIDELARHLGIGADRLAASIVPTPTCGLAVATPAYARRVFTVLTELGHTLVDAD